MLIRHFLNAPLTAECIHEGEGLCPHCMVISGEEFDTPVRFLNYTVIPPKCSFGQHKHGDDNELYIVLEGTGEYTEDGNTVRVAAGDILMNARFASHGIRNTGDTDMRLIVIEAYNS